MKHQNVIQEHYIFVVCKLTQVTGNMILKNHKKLNIEGIHLNTIKEIYNKSMSSIVLKKEKLETFPLKSGNKIIPLLSLLFHIFLEA